MMELTITNIPAISAIYYALLQCGYEFYPIERDAATVEALRGFLLHEGIGCDFFAGTKQASCEVYPYWPRAALLETAVFFIRSQGDSFDLNAYKDVVMSAKNISVEERTESFWNWIPDFPMCLKQVMQKKHFRRYFDWENDWIDQQNERYREIRKNIYELLRRCEEKFGLPVQKIQIVLNPIKCVYSADYHLKEDRFIYCSGALSEKAIVHELLHRIVHPLVERRKDDVLRLNLVSPEIESSYYLNHGEAGKLNGFEEHFVRVLSEAIVSGHIPESLEAFFDQELKK